MKDELDHHEATVDLPDELEVIVMVHDQDLLLNCESEGRFAAIPRLRYVFLGSGPVDKLAGREELIVARHLPDNIEEHNLHLLSFTGWYAVARNGLATTRYLALLEYDVKIAAGFFERTLEALRAHGGIVGYVPFPLSHPMYLHATPWLISALAEAHGIDLSRMIRDHLAAGGADEWTATTNAAMAVGDLRAIVDWLVPVTRIYRHDPIGAHVHERTLKVFCLLHGIENRLLPGLLTHVQARSHQIFALSRAEAEQRARATEPLL